MVTYRPFSPGFRLSYYFPTIFNIWKENHIPNNAFLNDVGQFRSRLGKIFENSKMFVWKRKMQV